MQKRVFIHIILSFFTLIVTFPVLAEEDITIPTESKIEQHTAERKVFMEQKRINLPMKPPVESTGEMSIRREEMKAKVENLREEMQQKREEAKTRFQEQREEFKQKVETIKDERKKKTLENIDTNINNLNVKHTESLQKILTRVTEILDRIDDKVASIEAEGKDTSTIKTSSTNARTLINTAAEAIKTQSGKEYIVNVTEESKLKDEVKKTFSVFRNDIKAVHEKVKVAREAVVQTARLYGQVVTQ